MGENAKSRLLLKCGRKPIANAISTKSCSIRAAGLAALLGLIRIFYTKSFQHRYLDRFHCRCLGGVFMVEALSMQHAMHHHVGMMIVHCLLLLAGLAGDHRRADGDVGLVRLRRRTNDQ